MKQTSRFLQFASYTFDASLIEILTTLIVGGCVCVPDEYTRLNAITDAINNMKVDTALLTPSFARLIDPSAVPGLRTLILGGEAMSKSHISTWAEEVDLINAYGPTECSVVAAVKSHISVDTIPGNIGRPIDTCWIVDPKDHTRLVPIGSVGELLIEGPTLAKGYLNNDQKTSEAFIKNPRWAGDLKGERRMYKTGDLVKYAPDESGDLIYVGRKDNQAKLHGQRLELEEVEHHLKADSAIQHALVTIPKAGSCAGKLMAVLSLHGLGVSKPASEELEILISPEASDRLLGIRRRLKARLPAYMVPSIWVLLQVFPLLPSGKLNRRQIERFAQNMDDDTYREISTLSLDDTSNSFDMTDVERRLQTIWGDVLNIPSEKVALNCSFLHLVSETHKVQYFSRNAKPWSRAETVCQQCRSCQDADQRTWGSLSKILLQASLFRNLLR